MEVLAQDRNLRYSAPPGPVMAEFDQHRIQRVLENLIGNAIKYSPDGGDIDIEMRADGRRATIAVRDRGMGIPEAERQRVFERGYRASGVGAIPGTGLGVFISAEIVRRHHGTITCSGAPDGGTIMEMELPLARVGLAAEAVQQLPGDGPGLAVADRAVVDGDNGHGLAGRAG